MIAGPERAEPVCAGIYLHVPVCRRKCRYCDFYSVADPRMLPRVRDLLLEEIETAEPLAAFADSLYFGGGTPSLLPAGDVAALVNRAARRFSLTADAEITLEINPGTVSTRPLADLAAAGVNRISIGVQTFDDSSLRRLGRIHTADQARQTLAVAVQAGFEDIGIDLIYGRPGQTRDQWQRDLDAAVAWAPAHIACYALTYETDTPLDLDRRAGRVTPLDEATVADQFRQAHDVLGAAGYEHYEISNFARSSARRSRHNQRYWTHAPYLGIGPSAHSFDGRRRRWWNAADWDVHAAALAHNRLPSGGAETLSDAQLWMETLYLGLRQSDGLAVAAVAAQFGKTAADRLDEAMAGHVATGRAEVIPRGYRLTVDGMLVLDGLVAGLAAAVDLEDPPH